MRLEDLSWDEFVEQYWPTEHGGTWYRGSELTWNTIDDCWEIERCDYDALSVETGIILGQRDPYELFDALHTIAPTMDDRAAMDAIASATWIHAPCYYINDPLNSPYWSDFEGEFHSDAPDDSNYVWHSENGVMTNRQALEEWADELQ